jgi:hypothetical protein
MVIVYFVIAVGNMSEEKADEIIDQYQPRLTDVVESSTADAVIQRLEVSCKLYIFYSYFIFC